jgi:hypothetical protein
MPRRCRRVRERNKCGGTAGESNPIQSNPIQSHSAMHPVRPNLSRSLQDLRLWVILQCIQCDQTRNSREPHRPWHRALSDGNFLQVCVSPERETLASHRHQLYFCARCLLPVTGTVSMTVGLVHYRYLQKSLGAIGLREMQVMADQTNVSSNSLQITNQRFEWVRKGA